MQNAGNDKLSPHTDFNQYSEEIQGILDNVSEKMSMSGGINRDIIGVIGRLPILKIAEHPIV